MSRKDISTAEVQPEDEHNIQKITPPKEGLQGHTVGSYYD